MAKEVWAKLGWRENESVEENMARVRKFVLEYRREIAPRINKRYGLNLNPEDENDGRVLRIIASAEHEEDECAFCNHVECHKRQNKYRQPDIAGLITRLRAGMNTRWVSDISGSRCYVGEKLLVASNIKQACLPEKYTQCTWDDYTIDADNERAVGIAKYLLENSACDKSLYLYGGAGCGKTFLATLYAKDFIGANRGRVLFGDLPSLLDGIKRTFDSKGGESAYDVMERYLKVDLLILDDIGVGKLTDWNVGIVYELINRRYNDGRPVLVTSNYSLESLERRLKTADEKSAERIVSRLRGMSFEAYMGEHDRRKED